MQFKKISQNIYQIVDVCNVYLLVDGDEAIAVNFGSGKWLPIIENIGIHKVEWVLITDSRRFHGMGLCGLKNSDIKIAASFYEKDLLSDNRGFWQKRRVLCNYKQINDFECLPEDIELSKILYDYDDFCWKSWQLKVLPAPGDSPGGIALCGEDDNKTIVFTGSLIQSGGFVPKLYPLQYAYGDTLGAALSMVSLNALSELHPDMLCPSSGAIIIDSEKTIAILKRKLQKLSRELYYDDALIDKKAELIKINENLFQINLNCCTWFALVNAEGNALLIDFGYAVDEYPSAVNALGYYPKFISYGIQEAFLQAGIAGIEAVVVTHYHDYHIAGIPYLKKHYAAEIWCLDKIAAIMENPEDYNLPCLFPLSLKADRIFADRETFVWDKMEFQMHHLPGQTYYHAALSFTMNGVRYAAVGDCVHLRNHKLSHGHIIFENRVTGNNHIKAAERLMQIQPDVLLNGHHRREITDSQGRVQRRADIKTTFTDLSNYKKSALELQKTMYDLIADKPALKSCKNWIRFEPYRLLLDHIDCTEKTRLIIENLADELINVSVEIVNYFIDKIDLDRCVFDVKLEPGEGFEKTIRIKLIGVSYAPLIICAAVRVNGEHMGWPAECQIYHKNIAYS